MTAREVSFTQVFGRELYEAREGCRRYRMYGDISGLDKAWDIYYGVSSFSRDRSETLTYHYFTTKVFRKVEKLLPQLTTLDLQFVSPSLLKARNLELAVPGTE